MAKMDIALAGDRLRISLNDQCVELPLPELQGPSLRDFQRLSHCQYVKDILNITSTLAMGINDRYDSNIMTHVKPSNRKLMNRAICISYWLLTQKLPAYKETHATVDYLLENKLKEQFLLHIMQVFYKKMRADPGSSHSIVLDTVEAVAEAMKSVPPEQYAAYLSQLQLSTAEQEGQKEAQSASLSSAPVPGRHLLPASIERLLAPLRLPSSQQDDAAKQTQNTVLPA
jgi:hypothetical protein